jgi:Zn-dependent peptidase ImmA (M78 family)
VNRAKSAPSSERCRQLLTDFARTFDGKNTTFPVNLGKLCAELGVRISHKNGIPRFQAYLADVGSNWEDAIIFLPAEGLGSPYERFCIAHEIAHLLLFRELVSRPSSASQHWKLEALCDDFARKLLVPDSAIPRHLTSREPISILRTVFALSRAAKVPWIQAALRISEFQCDVFFLRLGLVPNERTKILASTFPRQKERGRLIDDDTEFGSLADLNLVV